jgi:hypothetical protein
MAPVVSSGAMDQAWDIAGRIVLVVDAAVPETAREACAETAATLAQRTGMPVTVATVPIQTLDAVQPLLRRSEGRIRELAPPAGPGALSSAPFVWRDGRPDWGAMWTTFCDLALYGGPPQRGAEQALRGPATAGGAVDSSPEMRAEIVRGIRETTGLPAEAGAPGWVVVTCESPRMAAWLCAAVILENVEARVEGDRLLLPAGPDFRLEDQVKSVITVTAKTHHHWREHLRGGRPA